MKEMRIEKWIEESFKPTDDARNISFVFVFLSQYNFDFNIFPGHIYETNIFCNFVIIEDRKFDFFACVF